MKYWVYKITHIDSGRVYVGKTSRPTLRWSEHIRASSKPDKRGYGYLQRSIAKYGKDAFRYEIIDATMTEVGAYRAEQVWIEHLNCKAPAGFNLNGGGLGSFQATAETKAKQSAAALGKRKSPETIERMRAAKRTPEAIAKVRATHTGKHLSQETIDRLRASKRTPSAIAKVREARLGSVLSEETKRKIADRARQRWADPEFRKSFGRSAAETDKR